MDRRRLALVRGGDDEGFLRVGTGYLIAPRLVLTARHVVEERPGAPWRRIDTRVGHPHDGIRSRRASVCWTHPEDRDVALLLLEERVEVRGAAVRWGSPVGTVPLPYDALGYPLASTRDGLHSVEHLRGELPPLAGGDGPQDRYVLDQGPAPGVRADGERAWSGASGSAVFCGDHLVGVVIHDDEAFENRRLHACPARSFTDDPGFTGLLERYGDGPPELVRIGGGSDFAAGADDADDLERYLHAARLAAAQHPYPGVVPGTMPPLSDVYVRQYVVRQKSPREEEGRGRDTTLGAESLLAMAPQQPADEVLTGDGIRLVVAGPGGGKSSLLRTRLAHGVRDLLDAPDEHPVPVLVPAAALHGAPLTRALAHTVNAQLHQYGLTVPLPDDFFADRPRRGTRWLVLVDGLDEITGSDGREDVLRTVAHAGDRYAFIVTTRPVPEAEFGILGAQVPRYHLEPFGPDEVERIARGWFRALELAEPEVTARQFTEALAPAGLSDLARVPLTMSMLCQLHAVAPGSPLPRGRGEIYRNFVELLHSRQYTSGPSGVVHQAKAAMKQYGSDAEVKAERIVQGLRGLLAYLAYELLDIDDEDDERPVVDIVQEHECAGRPEAVPERRWRDFLESVLCGTGLLTRRADDLVFTHHTFVEYFAALYVTSDEDRLRSAFRETFVNPARYFPGSLLAIGVRPRLWLSRYWQPPFFERFGGFLLDLVPEDYPLRKEFLSRMASRRAGLAGFEYLVGQRRLGTSLPEDVVQNAVRRIREMAHDSGVDGTVRVLAARVLAKADAAGGAELLRDLTRDSTLNAFYRMQAAKALADVEPALLPEVFRGLALDRALSPHRRTQVLGILTELDPAGGAELLDVLAGDSALPFYGVDSWNLLEAAKVLAKVEPEAGIQRLRSLAGDRTVADFYRVDAAQALADLDPVDGAELLRTLARDSALDGFARAVAPTRLFTIDPESATALLQALAHETSLRASHRLRAARNLVRYNTPQGLSTLRKLRRDDTLGLIHRWRATLTLIRNARSSDSG
ncbi:MAG: NACHT domain-containing protein [Streptomyces sp.]|nr:NACHT domain-containing protein [Streptomyces sp.]